MTDFRAHLPKQPPVDGIGLTDTDLNDIGVTDSVDHHNQTLTADISKKRRQGEAEASSSIKAVAIYEILKGLGALLAAAALWLWHRDLTTWLGSAQALWQHYFGQLLINQVDGLVTQALKANQHWHVFVGIIIGYASLRFIEAYGLWHDKTWAYWYSVLGYGIFIPVELYYLVVSPLDWFKVLIFILNIVIVVVVYRNMKRKGLI
ncbi:MAG: DUF2127 domain-containing protein [Psychrobacter sp.]|nr:DUF2127 domain-containing protein [Psychrobacter sp.]